MDWGTVLADLNNLLAAVGVGFGIWAKYTANRAADDATQKAAQAVDHSKAVGVRAESNREDINVLATRFADGMSDMAGRTDEMFAEYVRAMALLEALPNRVESLERALLWLAEHVGATGTEKPAASDTQATDRVQEPATGFLTGIDVTDAEADATSTVTGKHRLQTQHITTIEGDPV